MWNKRFILINLVFFLIFSSIAFFYLYPLALNAMGSPDYMIGVVIGLFSASTVLSRPFLGKAVARWGEPLLIFLGTMGIVIASISYAFEDSVGISLLLIRVLHGVAFSAFIAGAFSLVAKTFAPSSRAQAYGVLGAALMAASALSPPIGEALIHRFGFTYLYLAAATSACAALLLVALTFKSISLPSSNNSKPKVQYTRLLKDRSFLFLLLSTLAFAHCQSTVLNFVALLAKSKGTSSGLFFALTFSTAIIILLLFSRKIDQFGKRRFLRMSYPLLASGILIIPTALNTSLILLPSVLFGMGMGLLFPAHNALAADHGSSHEKAGVMSLFTATYDTGFITGAAISGWVAQVIGIDHLFHLTGAVASIGFTVVLLGPIKEQ